jgi:hypothetical protein
MIPRRLPEPSPPCSQDREPVCRQACGHHGSNQPLRQAESAGMRAGMRPLQFSDDPAEIGAPPCSCRRLRLLARPRHTSMRGLHAGLGVSRGRRTRLLGSRIAHHLRSRATPTKGKDEAQSVLAAHTHGFSSALTLVHRDNPSHPRLGRCARAVGRCSNAEGRAKRKCESAARLYGSGRDRRCPAWRGRFISVACGSHVYHNVGDRWPKAIDASTMARYARAFANGALELARQTR